MSIASFKNLSTSVGAVLIHCPSASMQLYLKQIIKDKFNVDKENNIDIMDKKRLNDSKIEGLNRPLFGEKWIYHVNAELFKGKNDLTEGFTNISENAVTFYWTTEYRTYMNLQKLHIFKNQPLYFQKFSFSRFEDGEIQELINSELDDYDDVRLPKKVKRFVMQNYRYEVQSVFDLIANILSGIEYTNDRDVVKSIGLGGNSADSLVVFFLAKDFTTDKQVRSAYQDFIMRLDDLYTEYSPRTIRNFMLSAVNTIIEIKQLELLGVYNKIGREIPPNFNEKKINRFKRFQRIILGDITLPKALLFRQQFYKYNNFDYTYTNLQVVSGYLNLYHTIPPKDRKTRKVIEAEASQVEQARIEETLETMHEYRIQAKKATAERFGLTMEGEDYAPKVVTDQAKKVEKKEKSMLDLLMEQSRGIDPSLYTTVKTPQEHMDEYRMYLREKEEVEQEKRKNGGKLPTNKTDEALNENQHKLVKMIIEKHNAEGMLWISSSGDIVNEDGERLTNLTDTEKSILRKHIKEVAKKGNSGKATGLRKTKHDKSSSLANKKEIRDYEGVAPKFIDDDFTLE